jgi:hypothetical protein
MPSIDLTDAELASLARAARIAREQARGGAAKQENPAIRASFEGRIENYSELSVKLEAARKSSDSQQKGDVRNN